MLASAGQRGITATDSPACLADLQILEARAHASLRDPARQFKPYATLPAVRAFNMRARLALGVAA